MCITVLLPLNLLSVCVCVHARMHGAHMHINPGLVMHKKILLYKLANFVWYTSELLAALGVKVTEYYIYIPSRKF
jgi:hypothetical protein